MIEISPAHQRVLQYFVYAHLPEHLREISKPVSELAHTMVTLTNSTDNPAEVTVGLRKLLEAKDCFVRSMIK